MPSYTFSAHVAGDYLHVFSDAKMQTALFSVNLKKTTALTLTANNKGLALSGTKTNMLECHSAGQTSILWLSSCDSAEEAHQLLSTISLAMRDANRPDLLSRLKPWLAVLCSAMLALGIFAGLSNIHTQSPSSVRSFAAQPSAPPARSVQNVRPKTPLPVIPAAHLAANLKKAADRGFFTIPYSSDHERTLYLYSDPECPHCQQLNPLFKALSEHYNIVIFPVTKIGGDKTVAEVAPILCLPADKRKAAWEKLFSIDDGMLHLEKAPPPSPAAAETTTPCKTGVDALSVNDISMKAYRFPGTPWVISDDGRHVPQSVMASPDEMTRFMTQKTGE